MLKDTTTPAYEAYELVENIKNGKIAMPDFQRDFVWKPKNVISLLASVSNEWPIGSILMSDRGPNSPIASLRLKKFEGATDPDADKVEYIVLDGQQRLTAFLHAFMPERSDTIYYVPNFHALYQKYKTSSFDDVSLTEADFASLSQSEFKKQYPTITDRASSGVTTVADIANSENFLLWVGSRNIPNWQQEIGQLENFRKKAFGELEKYKITALQLSSDLGLEPLAVIFETVNKTGVRLDVDDLMLAKLYPSGFHLHDKWDQTLATHANLNDFGDEWSQRSIRGSRPITALDILKLIAYREKGAIKRGDILTLEPGVVSRYWDTAAAALNNALGFLRNECGVVHPNLLPDETIVLPVAAVYWNKAVDIGLLKRWYWRAIVDETYLRNTSTQPVADANTLMVGKLPGAFSVDEHGHANALTSLIDKLIEQRRSHDVLMKGVCCLLIVEGAEDWIENSQLSQTNSDLEIHHIFPMQYSLNQGWRKNSQDNPANITANLTPLLAISNKSIGSNPPKVIVDNHVNSSRAIKSHILDDDVFSVSSLDEFKNLTRVRAEIIAKKLLERC